MNDEQIIRQEAREFYGNGAMSNPYSDTPQILTELKYRLLDFYSPEYKAIFLDELEQILTEDLQNHIKVKHKGDANAKCGYDEQKDKISFYINQELSILPKIAHQKFKTNEKKSRNKVFISYSHFDKDYLHDIQRHFKPFLNQLEYWDDNKIDPGKKWKEEIKSAINETKVAILLVSTDFLGSEFIQNDELPPLLKAAEEEGAVILIVILKPCLFEEFSELNKFQTMNPPNRPVSRLSLDEKEELFVNLVRQTKRILNEIK